jgi:drug/metabolite transporter (DMT)-like permease
VVTARRSAQTFIAVVAILVAGVLWGAIGVFVRRLDDLEYSPLTIVFARMSIAAILLAGFFVVTRRTELFLIKLRDIWWFAGAGLASSILLNYFYSVSIVMNPLSVASILLASAPIFVVAISAFVFKEKVTLQKVLALVLVFAGCVLVSGIFGGGSGAPQGNWFSASGVAIGFASALGWGLYGVLSRVALNRGYNSLTINFWAFLLGALACVPFTDFGVIGRTVADQPGYMTLLLVLHTLCAALLPYALFTYGMRYVDTGTAAILASVEPVASSLIGFFVYHEQPTVIVILGIGVVLAGVVVMNLRWRAGQAAPAPET